MKNLLICLLSIFTMVASAQEIKIEGYVFESNNRGFIRAAQVRLLDAGNDALVAKAWSNDEGYFVFNVPKGDYRLEIEKGLFKLTEVGLADAKQMQENTYFINAELIRKPGYLLDLTIAEERDSFDNPTDAILDTRIEVYNNTNDELEYEVMDFKSPNFTYTITKGHHYTFMIRKKGYFTKRIEAHVDVDGCILCIEGLDKMSPGVTENISQGNEMGVLLANLSLEKINLGKTIVVDNLYYQTGKYEVTPAMHPELEKVVLLLRDNPSLQVEIGAHTDSKGGAANNLSLSQKRAKAVATYLIDERDLRSSRVLYRGYGETKLVNDCVDGADCSDAEHALNRRTEVKIVGFVEEVYGGEKSLQQIKADEKIELMLRNLDDEQFQEIQIKEGEDIPDDIKKDLGE